MHIARTILALLVCSTSVGLSDEPTTARGEQMFAEYFRRETKRLQDGTLANIKSPEDWTTRRTQLKTELLDMLGLAPLPPKTDLKPVVTGTTEHDEFVVEKIHFQSQPGLYVTANLYRPKEVKTPLPAVLYVCGHGQVKKGDVSFGNKVHYQHHGAWFARNGYVCLIVDSHQLGEIEGLHHGTHHLGMWWWINRGYVPAGVEAWNCVRALDYLETRPEVDKTKFGVTGRSGGGAYSWWIAAIDERIQCAVPVAGITDLQNHIVDGCVEGHCDCMYLHNTYEWDYPTLAALVAPRPLLITNTDSDGIFPLDGVVRTFEKVRPIYKLYNMPDKVGLSIVPGPHKDTQDIQVPAFRWLNKHLKGSDAPIEKLAVKYFEPEQLRVFEKLPDDQINTKIQETFVPAAKLPEPPASVEAWKAQRTLWLNELHAKTFKSWPEQAASPQLKPVFDVKKNGIHLRAYDFTSQEPIDLRLYVAQREDLAKPDLMVLNVLDETGWKEFLATYRGAFEEQLKTESLPDADEKALESHQKMFKSFAWTMAYVAPRGIGPTAVVRDAKKHAHFLRRFQLLGQMLESGQVYDARRAIQAARTLPGLEKTPLWLQAHRQMAGVALYASLYEPDLKRIDLHDLPLSHRDGPILFNIDRTLAMQQTVALAAERTQVILYQDNAAGWEYSQSVAKALEWNPKQIQIRVREADEQ